MARLHHDLCWELLPPPGLARAFASRIHKEWKQRKAQKKELNSSPTGKVSMGVLNMR